MLSQRQSSGGPVRHEAGLPRGRHGLVRVAPAHRGRARARRRAARPARARRPHQGVSDAHLCFFLIDL